MSAIAQGSWAGVACRDQLLAARGAAARGVEDNDRVTTVRNARAVQVRGASDAVLCCLGAMTCEGHREADDRSKVRRAHWQRSLHML